MISWLVGPIFVLECVLAARRWQTYAGRTAFLALLFFSLMAAWIWWVPGNNRNALARMGEVFFCAIAGTQLVVALLAAPAYFAASICLDKARGVLTHILVTDLSAREIVLGKVGALGSLVFGPILAGAPVMILVTFLGGIEPGAVIGSLLATLSSAALVSAVALLFSVWCRKPVEAILATYLFEAAWLLAWPAWKVLPRVVGPAPDWLTFTNPFAVVFGPYFLPGGVTIENYALFIGVCVGAAAVLTLVAAMTLRWAVCREVVRRPWRWRLPSLTFLSPALDFNPVLWREWRRPMPSLWLRITWGIYWLACIGASVVGSQQSNRGGELGPIVNAFQFSIGLLLAAITSVASLFEERVNGSLDMLLTTPLSTGTIVWGKWLAGLRVIVPLMVLPVLVCCAEFAHPRRDGSEGLGWIVLLIPLMFAYGVMINSLGLALATLIPRFGVAMGLTVAVYVALAAGPVLLLLGSHHGEDGRGFASLSPWYGVGETTAQVHHLRMPPGDSVAWKLTWIVAYAAAAIVLLTITFRNFDRYWAAPPNGRLGENPL